MQTDKIVETLNILYSELFKGPPNGKLAYMLNGGDVGLLESLDKLSAEAASATHGGGASIAAHVEHLRYGLALMNRWAAGEENPWAEADWTAAWRTTAVNETEWVRLRGALRGEAERWLEAIGRPREMTKIELSVVVGNIGHLGYHLGAIRQIDRATRGPSATEAG